MQVSVDTARMTQAATDLRNLKQQLSNAESSMKSNEASLSSQWEGEAHDEFHRAFDRNVNEFHAFLDTIDKYCVALDRYVQNYVSVENKNKGVAKTS